jgi:hypothetical protein
MMFCAYCTVLHIIALICRIGISPGARNSIGKIAIYFPMDIYPTFLVVVKGTVPMVFCNQLPSLLDYYTELFYNYLGGTLHKRVHCRAIHLPTLPSISIYLTAHFIPKHGR